MTNNSFNSNTNKHNLGANNMSNKLSIFNFNKNKVRTSVKNNDVLFCLKDVCQVLGISNHKNVVTRLNPKGVHTMDTLTNGGKQTCFNYQSNW